MKARELEGVGGSWRGLKELLLINRVGVEELLSAELHEWKEKTGWSGSVLRITAVMFAVVFAAAVILSLLPSHRHSALKLSSYFLESSRAFVSHSISW